MEFFEEKFIPYQMRVKIKGTEHLLSTKPMTQKTLRKMNALTKDEEGTIKTMELMFDKPASFWEDVSFDFMAMLINHVTAQLKKKGKSQTETETQQNTENLQN